MSYVELLSPYRQDDRGDLWEARTKDTAAKLASLHAAYRELRTTASENLVDLQKAEAEIEQLKVELSSARRSAALAETVAQSLQEKPGYQEVVRLHSELATQQESLDCYARYVEACVERKQAILPFDDWYVEQSGSPIWSKWLSDQRNEKRRLNARIRKTNLRIRSLIAEARKNAAERDAVKRDRDAIMLANATLNEDRRTLLGRIEDLEQALKVSQVPAGTQGREYLRTLQSVVDEILAGLDRKDINEAVNWADLYCVEAAAGIDQRGVPFIRILIEEAAEGCEKLSDAVRAGLLERGYPEAKQFRIKTEW